MEGGVTATKQNTRQGLRSSCGNYVELQGKEKEKKRKGYSGVAPFGVVVRRCLSKVLRNAKPATLVIYIQPWLFPPLASYSFPALSILVTSFAAYYLLYMLNNPFNLGLNTLLSELFVPVLLLCLNSLSSALWGSFFSCFSLYPELIRLYYIKIRGITWLKELVYLMDIVYMLLSVMSVWISFILLNKRIWPIAFGERNKFWY